MKKYIRDTWCMYVTFFVFCFMLFLYEPLMMYLSNISDFWFGIGTIFRISFKMFFVILMILFAIFNAIYFKSKKIFNISIITVFIVFLCSYIQGNFLAGSLPVLDGTPIVWSNYVKDWIISIVLWGVVIGGVIFITKKVSIENMKKYSGYVCLGIFVMLSLSLATSYLTCNESVVKKYIPLTTFKNYNKYSDDKNFIIFLLDAVDSRAYYDSLKADDDFKDILSDFTYYPDTMSGHPCTNESVPLILAGEFYHNEDVIGKWSTKAYKESYFFDLLEKNNYEINIYERDLFYDDSSVNRVANIYSDSEDIYKIIDKSNFMKQEIKYSLFKYLPSFLKRFSRIEKMDFSTASVVNRYRTTDSKNKGGIDNKFFNQSNIENLKIYRENKIEKVNDRVFKFIHLNGSHTPYETDKNLNTIKNGTYKDAIDTSLTLTKEYLNMLKKNDIYDNSIIIVMADHGFESGEYGKGRQNPILFAKGINEKHGSMKISDKAVHFTDLSSLYTDLINGKKSSEAFANLTNKRVRTFLDYKFNTKKHMVEYETKDKAWELDKMYKTGKVFDRK